MHAGFIDANDATDRYRIPVPSITTYITREPVDPKYTTIVEQYQAPTGDNQAKREQTTNTSWLTRLHNATLGKRTAPTKPQRTTEP